MDEFQRAKARSDRLVAKGIRRPSYPPPIVHIKEEPPKADVPVLLKPKPEKGKGRVRIEVRVWLHDDPLLFAYNTEMRSHILASQLNYRWLSQKFKDMMKEWRVHDIPGGS
jgi:hypothetical protein